LAKVRSRVLVIDASIAMAAGEISMHPTSRNCREFLQAVLDICHRMVLTKPIQDEWNRHQSSFARKWRASMMARKKIVLADVSADVCLQNEIARFVFNESTAAIIEKDRHLIEAALVTDKRVASLDDRVRRRLHETGQRLPHVASICWVNPNTPGEQAIGWLEAGTPDERFRKLGYVAT
jgi:hypothetical protein